MVRRHRASPFMPDAHVFPGGRVDPADFGATPDWCDGVAVASQQLRSLPADDALAHAVAAARELFEEAGVLLARHAGGDLLSTSPEQSGDPRGRPFRDIVEGAGLRLGLDLLVPFARWITPPGDTRRFDTWFFAARVPAGQTATHDGTEATAGRWLTPGQATTAALAQEILLPPPTWVTLRELQPFQSVDDILTWAQRRNIERRQPDAVEEDGRRVIVLPRQADVPDAGASESRFVWTGDRWRPEGMA